MSATSQHLALSNPSAVKLLAQNLRQKLMRGYRPDDRFAIVLGKLTPKPKERSSDFDIFVWAMWLLFLQTPATLTSTAPSTSERSAKPQKTIGSGSRLIQLRTPGLA